MKSRKNEDILAFGILKNRNIITVSENTVQVINETSTKTIQLDLPAFSPHFFPHILMTEIQNHLLVLAGVSFYGSSGVDASYVMILDLKQGVLLTTKIIVKKIIKSVLCLDDHTLLMPVVEGRPLLFSFENCDLIEIDNRLLPDAKLGSEFIVFPDDKRIIHASKLKAKLSHVTITGSQFEERATLKIPDKYIIKLLSLPGKRLCFVSGMIHKKPQLHLCNSQLTLLDTIVLKSTLLTDPFSVDKIISLEENGFLVMGKSPRKEKCILLFAIINDKLKKITEINIDSNQIFSSLPTDQFITCSPTGEMTLHHLLPSDKLRMKTENMLLNNFTPDIINIITDYAGFFRPKSDKIKSNLLFNEIKYSEEIKSKNKCIVS